jgi:glycosyltransferase involved in cell wall biosynthesis
LDLSSLLTLLSSYFLNFLSTLFLQLPHTALYAAFDIFPSHKGAGTHIAHFSEALFEWAGNGWLHVLGDGEMPNYQIEANQVEITRFQQPIQNFLARAGLYGQELYENIALQATTLEICHFRDIWSALPLLAYQENEKTSYKTIFEVNSLPSIELPYRYKLPPSTLAKIKWYEKYCLTKSQVIIVPSKSIAQFLVNQGVEKNKIQVIYNGAEVLPNLAAPVLPTSLALPPQPYLIYFGTLQTWQGVEVLLRAFALLPDLEINLLFCLSLKEKFSRPFEKLAAKLGIADKVHWQYRLDKATLQQAIRGALFSVAPLTACSRNLQQGCCPLKILESMACGVPVLASDLPVVCELIENNHNGLLFKADRPSELARKIRILVENQAQRQFLGQNAYQTIAKKFTWKQKKDELQMIYAASLN